MSAPFSRHRPLGVGTASVSSARVFAEVAPQREWLQVRSPHFSVMGDAGGRELRQVAERMEQLHELLAMLRNRGEVP